MRYILDNLGYIEEISFSNEIVCHNDTCTEYNGSIPSGYNSLSDWSTNANIRAYKIVNGNLTYDSTKDAALQSEWASQETSTTPELSINKVTSISSSSTDTQYPSAKCVYDELSDKQDALQSGTNIKTINNTSLLGSGNISIPKGDKGDTGDKGDPFTYDDFTPEQLASLKGDPGDDGNDGNDGYSPTVAVHSNTDDEYTLDITDKNGTITTPNLKGSSGSGSTINVNNQQSSSTTDTYSCNYVNGITNYTTNEVVIGKWIDGKNVYRRVYVGNNVSHGSTILTGIDTLISCIGMGDVTTGADRQIPYYESYNNRNYCLRFTKSGDSVIIDSVKYGNAANATFTCVFEYTKTTD